MRPFVRSFWRRVIAASFIAIPCVARAQAAAARHPRSPIWATLSVGRGDLQVNCGICRQADQSSWAADVSLGGWVGPRTALGGEMGAWRLGGDDATQRLMLFGLVTQLYPLTKAPAFVKLGAGFMGYRSSDGEQALSARSLALQAGFGYDVHVRQYLVVPHVGLIHGFNNGMYLDDAKVTSAAQVKLIRFGLGVGVGR